MRIPVATAIFFTVIFAASPASAGYLTIHDEEVKLRRAGWVVFPITNETGYRIEAIYGSVYRYKDEKPYNFIPVSNRHIQAVKIRHGGHKPGKKMLYAFKVPVYKMKIEKYGLIIYDAPIRFSK